MRGHGALFASMLALLAATPPDAAGEGGQRSAGTGNVVVNEVAVRDVQVREVRVPPAQRPSTAARPFLPDSISRRDQAHFSAPADRSSASRRSFASRSKSGSGLVGYPIGFPVYPFVFDQLAYTFYAPPAYPTPSAIASPSWGAPGLVAGTPSFAAIDCGVAPGASAPCGGLSFDVLPIDAQVSVEGIFVGAVDVFGPTRAPLVLAPGVHYVEVRRPGFLTAAFEVTVAPGTIVPYRGALEPLRTR